MSQNRCDTNSMVTAKILHSLSSAKSNLPWKSQSNLLLTFCV